MNCKFCNAELKEDALFCHECGAKVEDSLKEDVPKYCKCGAELSPSVKFCSQCGSAVTDNRAEDNAGIDIHIDTNKIRSFSANMITYIKARPKFFGILGAVIIVLIIGVSIGSNVFNNSSDSPKTSAVSNSPKTSTAGSSSTSSKMSDDYYKTLATSALYKEIQKKYTAADAGSTKYKINKTEKQKDYTIVYGKLYLYDKYGKASTGHSDGSGSYIRSFEVKIKNSTNTVSSCTIK